MASIYQLKPAFQSLLRPVTRKLADSGVTANQVTVAAMLLSIAVGVLLLTNPGPAVFFLVPLVLFVRMALNAIDGMLAREHNMATPLGAVLNELGDVISDTALYLPFAFLAGLPGLWIVLIVTLSVISEMTGVIGTQIGASRRYDGPMGKSDRAFVFGLIAIALGLEFVLPPWFDFVFVVIAVLLVITIYNRARNAVVEVEAK